MERSKGLINLLIIILTFLLLVFHTLTYFQATYSFIVTLVLYGAILMLAFISSNGCIDLYKIKKFVPIILATFFILVIGVIVRNASIINVLGGYLPILIWSSLYAIVTPKMTDKARKIFVSGFLIVLLVGLVATLSVLITDSTVARMLAGAGDEAYRAEYYAKGVGGYGFVYGWVFILFGIMSLVRREKRTVYKICLIALTVLTFITILYSSYTTAFMLSIIMIFLSVYSNTRSKQATVLFIIVVVLIVALLVPILSLLQDVARSMELTWIERRMGELISAEESDGLGQLRRSELYMKSINSFLENPIVGAGNVGGHSFVFDMLGNYGIFGLFFVIAVFYTIYGVSEKGLLRENLVYIVIMALLMINTLDSMVFLPMVLFALPLILKKKSSGAGLR